MKIWEKIYIVVLVLFVLVLNLCNSVIFGSIYKESVASAENMLATVWRTIAVSLAEDLSSAGEARGLFQTYVSYYNNQNRAFELWAGETLCYKSDMGTQITYSYQEGALKSDYPLPVENLREAEELVEDRAGGQQCLSRILQKDGEKYICSWGALSGTPYTLVLYEQDTGILSAWRRHMITFLVMEVSASLVMALLLYGIIKKFLYPVSQISQAAARVASGDYSPCLEIRGKDEIAVLAEDMNRMTEQVREHMADKERESLRKQEFIDAMSHELRTPLTSIRGYAQLVETAHVPEERKIEYLDYIIRESGRMEEMMKLLRQITLMNQGEIEWGETSLEDILQELQMSFAGQPEFSHIRLQMEAGTGVLWCNRLLAEMFFTNIVRNACQACGEKGEVTVTLRENGAVITDNGVGMSEECRQRIFEPFYREDKSRSRKRGGTGLGMYLCRRIADLHGWQFEIASEPGKGTGISVAFCQPEKENIQQINVIGEKNRKQNRKI